MRCRRHRSIVKRCEVDFAGTGAAGRCPVERHIRFGFEPAQRERLDLGAINRIGAAVRATHADDHSGAQRILRHASRPTAFVARIAGTRIEEGAKSTASDLRRRRGHPCPFEQRPASRPIEFLLGMIEWRGTRRHRNEEKKKKDWDARRHFTSLVPASITQTVAPLAAKRGPSDYAAPGRDRAGRNFGFRSSAALMSAISRPTGNISMNVIGMRSSGLAYCWRMTSISATAF